MYGTNDTVSVMIYSYLFDDTYRHDPRTFLSFGYYDINNRYLHYHDSSTYHPPHSPPPQNYHDD